MTRIPIMRQASYALRARALFACIALCVALPVHGQAAASRTDSLTAGGPHRCRQFSDSALASFIDSHFAADLDEFHVPGAVVVAVRNGRVVLERGFGLADVAKRTPVIPDSTKFYVGSISKVITATAVMQLVEQGVLDLDADVNTYLGDSLYIDSPAATPVTLRQLLTHTAGLDQRGIGIAEHSHKEVEPLGEHLRRRMPNVVVEPGRTFRYSNYGVALAGYIVELVTKEPFSAYARESVFLPREMQHSNFDQWYDDPWIATSYVWRGTAQGNVAASPAYFNIGPAVSMVSTASDMAKFMVAQLGDGELLRGPVLQPKTLDQMQTRQWGLDSHLAGSSIGFHHYLRGGIDVLSHGGLINEQTSIMELIPSAHFGIFVACNSAMCTHFDSRSDELLANFSCEPPVPHAEFSSTIDLGSLSGSYRPTGGAERNIEKLRSLDYELDMTAKQGTLWVSSTNHSREMPFVQEGPGLLRLVNGDDYIVLLPDDKGAPRVFGAASWLPTNELQKLHIWETRSFVRAFGMAAAGGLASAIVLLPVVLAYRRRRGSADGRGLAAISYIQGAAVSLLLLAFLFELGTLLSPRIQQQFIYGVPAVVDVALWLLIVAIALWLPLPVYAIIAWRRRFWSVLERSYYSVMTAGMFLLFLMLNYWNLVGFKY